MEKSSATYKQAIKGKSRSELWRRSIDALTKGRKSSRILHPSLVQTLWDHCFNDVLLKHGLLDTYDRSLLTDWLSYSQSIYGTRRAADLKIAYFCGPEPENDLAVLYSLGIRLENVWAFEADRGAYSSALAKAHTSFPMLKIHPGSFEDFLNFNTEKFDIIYLDFTAPLPLYSKSSKPYVTLHSVFEKQALAELSALVVVTAEPECDDAGAMFLASFFQAQQDIEGEVIGAKNDDGPIDWFCEGLIANGIYFPELIDDIKKNWTAAYSAFSTQYPLQYCNLVAPAFRVLQNRGLKKRLLAEDSTVESALKAFSRTDMLLEPGLGGDLIMSPIEYPLRHFLDTLNHFDIPTAKSWHGHYSQNERGVSRYQSICLSDLIRSVMEGYWNAISPTLLGALREINAALPDRRGGLFCDTPFPSLWAEIAINQLGAPHHCNVKKSWRASYCAKTRPMMVDLFILDRCRSFYDWLPMAELYGRDLLIIEKQILTRIFLNAIRRHQRYLVPPLYKYTNLVGYYELGGIVNPLEPRRRVNI